MKYPNINAERARAGMSSGDLANRLGVSRKTLYNWISNGNIPQTAITKMTQMIIIPKSNCGRSGIAARLIRFTITHSSTERRKSAEQERHLDLERLFRRTGQTFC